jgi:hypothetical protein
MNSLFVCVARYVVLRPFIVMDGEGAHVAYLRAIEKFSAELPNHLEPRMLLQTAKAYENLQTLCEKLASKLFPHVVDHHVLRLRRKNVPFAQSHFEESQYKKALRAAALEFIRVYSLFHSSNRTDVL